MRRCPSSRRRSVPTLRERLGRKPELNEWLDVPRLQVVVELVYLRPVIDGLSVLDTHGSQHVVKDVMESQVAEPELVDCKLELRLAVISNQRP